MGHEMLNEFNLINMNGRVYDPVLGRFLSPDKYVQEGDNSQNYNSYSYCLNNPLKYADPSGDVFVLDDFIAITAMGAMMGVMNAAMSDKPIWKGALLGAASAAATNRNMVRSSVINDLKRISNIPVDKPVNRIINVSGDKLQYTVFKRLENGEYIYNIGRIHGI